MSRHAPDSNRNRDDRTSPSGIGNQRSQRLRVVRAGSPAPPPPPPPSKKQTQSGKGTRQRSGDEASGPPPVDPNVTFEDAMADVESIIERIDEGEIGLADSLDAWERGMSLLTHCRTMLDRAEQRVEQIKIEAASGKGRAGASSRASNADEAVDPASDGPSGSGRIDGSGESLDEEDIPF